MNCGSPVRYVPALLAVVMLMQVGCNRAVELDCESVSTGTESAGLPTDSLALVLSDACSVLGAVGDSLAAIPLIPDFDYADDLLELARIQERLDSTLHAALAASAKNVTSSEAVRIEDSERAVLSGIAFSGGDLDFSDRLDALEKHIAMFDANIAFISQPAYSPEQSGLLRFEALLIDSLHEMLRTTLVRGVVANLGQPSQLYDSLSAEVSRLYALHRAYKETSSAYMSELGMADWLTGNLEEARLREFSWQLRHEATLLADIYKVLDAAAREFQRESSSDVVYRVEESVARLQDVVAELVRRSSSIEDLRAQYSEADPDSLRQMAEFIRSELSRQELILAGLGQSVESLSDPDRMRKSVQLLSETTALYGEVHNEITLQVNALLTQVGGKVRNYGLKTFLAILFLLLGFVVIRVAIWLLDTVSERSARRRLFYKRLIPMARLAVWSITVYIVLANVFQLDQRSLFAAATAVGVAIGFAAQNILKNVFGGIVIIFDQPFQVGDKIDVGGTYGEVVSIGLRTTRIITPHDRLVTVPNAQVIDSQVANSNQGSLHCQVVTELIIPGWADATKAKAIAYSAAANSKFVYMRKPIRVNMQDEFQETFLTRLRVKAYVLDARYENVFASEVTEAAKAEFKRQGIFTQYEQSMPPLKQP